MPPKLDIARDEDGSRGQYSTIVDGVKAVLDFRVSDTNTRIAAHVGVPSEIGGRGVGKALVTRMVADARAEGFRIVPQCPFVDAHRRRNKDWSDAFV